MRKYQLFVIVALFVALVGCKTKERAIAPTSVENTIIKTVTRTEWKTDTVFVKIPLQMAERTTKDSVSFLENEYAKSEARINPDGTLFHDLKTKPQNKPVEVQKQIEHRDTVIYKDKQIKVPVPVEKELNFWQKTSIKYFPYTLAALFTVLGYVLRKPIWKFVRRFI
jgi:hypothetical protein